MSQTRKLTDHELKSIELLCKNHFNVAIVGDRIYTFTSVEQSSMTTGISIEYTSMRAVDITNFIQMDRVANGDIQFVNDFKRYIDNKTYLQYKFNKTVDYTLITLTT